MLHKWKGIASKRRLMKLESKTTVLLSRHRSSTNFRTSMFNFIFQLSSILVHRSLTNRILLFLESWTSNSFFKPSFSIRCSFKTRLMINKCRRALRPSKIWWIVIHSFLVQWSLSKHLIFQVHPLSWTLKLNSWLNSNFFTNSNSSSSSSSTLWTINNRYFNSSSSSCLSLKSDNLTNQWSRIIGHPLSQQFLILSNLLLNHTTAAIIKTRMHLLIIHTNWFRRY